MSTSRTFTAVKQRDQLVLTAPVAYKQWIAGYGDGEEVSIIIKRKPKRQGSQAMRYLRGVVIPDIAQAAGYDDPDDYQEVFESLAWKFLRIADHPEFGYPRRKSTSKDEMPQAEMAAFIDQCIQWAETSIPGCRVRRPDEIENWENVPDYDWRPA